MATEPLRAGENEADARDNDIDCLPPMMARSLEAFRRDLPELLKTHRDQWVAYHGDERLWFGRTETELFKKCLGRGLKPDEFLVLGIEREIPDEDMTCSADW